MLQMPGKRVFILALLFIPVVGAADTPATDIDHDGVPDIADRCPNTAQLRKLPADFRFTAAVNPARLGPSPQAWPVDRHGCEPDTDGDGVINSRDFCPEDSKPALSMGVAENGCPRQSDADGTPDYRDRCPNTPSNIKTDRYGCEVQTRS